MKAIVVAMNTSRKRYAVKVKATNQYSVFEILEPLLLAFHEQVLGNFDQPGKQILIATSGIVFTANVELVNIDQVEALIWTLNKPNLTIPPNSSSGAAY
ncbi:hypothetical protein LG198_03465 [Methylobacillus arboreus]|uniref:hypothetical protein n=1 Tax=Methylobacillus arboreus TaxID=755170 RepID=UPI001E28710A|nr:hypothetical protein [Methylobacillus arboreus]MCB5189790.1 hypothetical protein [Methylobacillus arboreus]